MNQKAKKRALRIRLAVIYTIMVAAVLLLVAGLYFIIQGYRFNRFDGKVEQGGLVQFNTTPTGADVWLDQMRLANKTPSKLTVSAGNHTVVMSKQGYHSWKKDVTVRAGQILWLDYVRLVPEKLIVETPVQLAGAASSKVSHDAKTLAVMENAAEPVLTLVDLDAESMVKRSLPVPAAAYTAPASGELQSFEIYAWAYDNRYVLIKHTYGTRTEWISFNTGDGKTAKNLTRVLGVDATDVHYAKNDANTLLMLTAASEVRKTNIDQKTVSGPLLTNVHDFVMYDTDTVVFTTNQDQTTRTRRAGYFTIGAAEPRVVYETPADDGAPLIIRIQKYFGKFYQVVAHGESIVIYTGDLAASDAKNPAPFTEAAKLSLAGGVDYLGFSPDPYRFVYAGGGNRVVTYDLDLEQSASLLLQAEPQARIDWVDDTHFVASAAATLTLYNFDGTNGHEMLQNAVAGDVALAQSGRYLHAINTTNDITSVSRIRLIID